MVRFLLLASLANLMILGCTEGGGQRNRVVGGCAEGEAQHPSALEKRRKPAEPRMFTRLDIGNSLHESQPKNFEASDDFEGLIERLSNMNPNYLIFVDSTHPLDAYFEPEDLVNLALYPEISRSRDSLYLVRAAAEALAELSEAAGKDGVTLPVSSAYRTYEHQKNVFDDHVRRLGEKEASRQVAKVGTSQHQLGTAIDFGDVTNSFADTRASRWMGENGGKFGWSLSYPKHPPSEYMWESWHWRWIGIDAVRLQDEFFGGSQHRMLLYLHEELHANRLKEP